MSTQKTHRNSGSPDLNRPPSIASLTLSLLLTLACHSTPNTPSPAPSCPPGSLACPCLADATCTANQDQPLVCDRGFCVPNADCTAGSEGCRCYEKGSCALKDGIPMTCDGNICKVTVTPAAGRLNGECGAAQNCSTYDEQAISCIAGTCQLASCPSGNYLCPCAEYGRCSDFGGEAVLCNQGVCVKPNCIAGKSDCPCKPDATCNDGSHCLLGVCRLGAYGIGVTTSALRGCDVVIDLAETTAVSVDFAGDVRGQYLQRGAKVALSFISRSDEDLPRSAAAISTSNGKVSLSSQPKLSTVACYDRLGLPISEAKVNVQ